MDEVAVRLLLIFCLIYMKVFIGDDESMALKGPAQATSRWPKIVSSTLKYFVVFLFFRGRTCDNGYTLNYVTLCLVSDVKKVWFVQQAPLFFSFK